MEKLWLKNYPAGVPAEIDASQFRSLAQLLEHSFHTYADRRASWVRMGREVRLSPIHVHAAGLERPVDRAWGASGAASDTARVTRGKPVGQPSRRIPAPRGARDRCRVEPPQCGRGPRHQAPRPLAATRGPGMRSRRIERATGRAKGST